MATRREAREWVVQMLFHMDLNPRPVDDMFREFWASSWLQESRDEGAGRYTAPGAHGRLSRQAARAFAEETVRGILANRESIDAVINRYAENWNLARMAGTDRNILRLAIYEMQHCDDIPPVVTINEAVDLAKYFNNRESGRFVNGILDRVCRDLDRPSRTAGPAARGRTSTTHDGQADSK